MLAELFHLPAQQPTSSPEKVLDTKPHTKHLKEKLKFYHISEKGYNVEISWFRGAFLSTITR